MNKTTVKSFRNGSQTNVVYKRRLKSDLQNVVRKNSPLVIGKPLASRQKDNGYGQMIKYVQHLEKKVKKREKTKVFTSEDTQSQKDFRSTKKCGGNINGLYEYLTSNSIVDQQMISHLLSKSPNHSLLLLKEKQKQIQQMSQILDQLTIENKQLKQQQKDKKAYQYTVDKLLQENIKYKTIINTYTITKNEESKFRNKICQENQLLREQNQMHEAQISKQNKIIEKDYEKHILTLNRIIQQNVAQFYKNIEKKEKIIKREVDKLESKLRIAQDALSIIKTSDHSSKKTNRKLSCFSATLASPSISIFSQNQQYSEKKVNYDAKKREEETMATLNIIQNKLAELNKQNMALAHILETKQIENKQKNTKISDLETEVANLKKQLKDKDEARALNNNNVVQYAKQVNQIRQMLLSCNPSNFDTFQIEFKQIIQQRNNLNNKIMKFKEMKEKTVPNIHFENSTNFLLAKIKILEEENMKLVEQVQSLKRQLLLKRASELSGLSNIDIQLMNSVIALKDNVEGFQGLEWQKTVQQCILLTAQKLGKLTSYMQQN